MLPPSAMRVVDLLAAHPGVEQVRLFGSRARGDHDLWSDVAVDAPTLTHGDRACLAADVDEAETLYTIDLVWAQETTPDFRARIDAEGVTLYDHQRTPASHYGPPTLF